MQDSSEGPSATAVALRVPRSEPRKLLDEARLAFSAPNQLLRQVPMGDQATRNLSGSSSRLVNNHFFNERFVYFALYEVAGMSVICAEVSDMYLTMSGAKQYSNKVLVETKRVEPGHLGLGYLATALSLLNELRGNHVAVLEVAVKDVLRGYGYITTEASSSHVGFVAPILPAPFRPVLRFTLSRTGGSLQILAEIYRVSAINPLREPWQDLSVTTFATSTVPVREVTYLLRSFTINSFQDPNQILTMSTNIRHRLQDRGIPVTRHESIYQLPLPISNVMSMPPLKASQTATITQTLFSLQLASKANDNNQFVTFPPEILCLIIKDFVRDDLDSALALRRTCKVMKVMVDTHRLGTSRAEWKSIGLQMWLNNLHYRSIIAYNRRLCVRCAKYRLLEVKEGRKRRAQIAAGEKVEKIRARREWVDSGKRYPTKYSRPARIKWICPECVEALYAKFGRNSDPKTWYEWEVSGKRPGAEVSDTEG